MNVRTSGGGQDGQSFAEGAKLLEDPLVRRRQLMDVRRLRATRDTHVVQLVGQRILELRRILAPRPWRRRIPDASSAG
jgi:hypothetical protein